MLKIAKSYWFYIIMVLIGSGLVGAGIWFSVNWLKGIGLIWLAVWGLIYYALKRAE
jgi:hypothetical protein